MTNTGKATLALIPLACLSVQNLYSQDTRPDIVLLLADDWEFPHATPYGDRVVDTGFSTMWRRRVCSLQGLTAPHLILLLPEPAS